MPTTDSSVGHVQQGHVLDLQCVMHVQQGHVLELQCVVHVQQGYVLELQWDSLWSTRLTQVHSCVQLVHVE